MVAVYLALASSGSVSRTPDEEDLKEDWNLPLKTSASVIRRVALIPR